MRRREVTKALELAPDLVVAAESDNQIVAVTLGTTVRLSHAAHRAADVLDGL